MTAPAPDAPKTTTSKLSDPATTQNGPNPALQAPWRLQYLETIDDKKPVPGAAAPGPPTAAPAHATSPTPGVSFLLDYWLNPAADAKNHVVVRTRDGLILLNAFPYASGHLLVALGEPRPTLLDYTPEQRAALWRLVDCAADLVTRTLEPQGINIGVNQGRAAGAGVPSHLHVHLVPRWGGDTNFISVVGNVRIIPASLETMAERYRGVWERIKGQWA